MSRPTPDRQKEIALDHDGEMQLPAAGKDPINARRNWTLRENWPYLVLLLLMAGLETLWLGGGGLGVLATMVMTPVVAALVAVVVRNRLFVQREKGKRRISTTRHNLHWQK